MPGAQPKEPRTRAAPGIVPWRFFVSQIWLSPAVLNLQRLFVRVAVADLRKDL